MWRGNRIIGSALASALAALSIPGAALAEPAEPSPTAGKISGLYDPIFWAVVAVFAVVGPLLVLAALRPRPQPADNADDPPATLQGLTSRWVEIAWTVAPAALLGIIAVLAYRAFH